jgi:chloride channel 7
MTMGKGVSRMRMSEDDDDDHHDAPAPAPAPTPASAHAAADDADPLSAGAAAGVASAFGAPVGGLLFVLEEISSFWSHRLAWETFFCCMLSTITTELITNSFQVKETVVVAVVVVVVVDNDMMMTMAMLMMMMAPVQAFQYSGNFGLFSNKGSYVFYVDVKMKSQLYMFLPTVVLGVVGGCLGAVFTWLNLKIAKFRNRWIARWVGGAVVGVAKRGSSLR